MRSPGRAWFFACMFGLHEGAVAGDGNKSSYIFVGIAYGGIQGQERTHCDPRNVSGGTEIPKVPDAESPRAPLTEFPGSRFHMRDSMYVFVFRPSFVPDRVGKCLLWC